MFDLFAAAGNRRLSACFFLVPDPELQGTDVFAHSWFGLRAYVVSATALVRLVINKVRRVGMELLLVASLGSIRSGFRICGIC